MTHLLGLGRLRTDLEEHRMIGRKIAETIFERVELLVGDRRRARVIQPAMLAELSRERLDGIGVHVVLDPSVATLQGTRTATGRSPSSTATRPFDPATARTVRESKAVA